MNYIDPHIHMVCCTTGDYERMAYMGCVAVSEPAFWAGFDRRSAESFRDYFRQIAEFEPKRAAQYGIAHSCWLCINAKEAQDVSLSREVIAIIPEFLDRPNVLGLGEVGLNKNTPNECIVFAEHLELAASRDEVVLVHTPHLGDKYKGTRMILDMIADESRLRPERIIIDHCEEHTVRLALDAGHWAGLTLYPNTKCTPARAADVIEQYGVERIWVNSAADWGPSTPDVVPAFIHEMKMRGHPEALIRKIVYENPIAFMSQCRRWSFEAGGGAA